MSDPKRIQSIIQRHVEALSRDLAQELSLELAKPLLDRWGFTVADAIAVRDVTAPEATPAVSEPVGPTALSYDPKTRRWVCPRCRKFSDTRRRAVTTHMRFCDGTPEPQPAVAKPRRKPRKNKS